MSKFDDLNYTMANVCFLLFYINNSRILHILTKESKYMNLLQEYKELYNHEMAFSDRLNAKISNSLAIITIIGTGEAIVWKDCLGDNFNIVFFGLCLISLQSFIYTLYKFYKAYTNYTYGYYPIQETKVFADSTIKIVKANGKGEELAYKHIEKILGENYIKAAIINRNQNLLKSNAHRSLNKWIIISVVSIFICYTCGIIVSSEVLSTLI